MDSLRKENASMKIKLEEDDLEKVQHRPTETHPTTSSTHGRHYIIGKQE